MPKFEFTKIVNVDRDLIFRISTEYENFTKILPDYFKKMKVIEANETNVKIYETINFLGRTATVLTEHVIVKPNRHIVTMLDKLLGYFAKGKIKAQMNKVMNEFVDYANNNTN